MVRVPKRPGLRKMTSVPYLIFYRPDQTTLKVVRVLHSSRDLEEILGGEQGLSIRRRLAGCDPDAEAVASIAVKGREDRRPIAAPGLPRTCSVNSFLHWRVDRLAPSH
jgi:hypothetical protein